MKNKTVGFLIIGIALLIGFITFLFNRGLSEIVAATCSHGESCIMWDTIKLQTNIAIILMLFVVVIGLYLIFFGKEEKVVTKIITHKIEPKKINKKDFDKIMSKMTKDEKKILKKLIEADGTLFQGEIVEKTEFTKVKVSRILDRLEGKGIVERKRRGMTNIVILKSKR